MRLRSDNRTTAGWFLVFVTGALLLLIVALNEVLRVIGTERLRYLIALWPLVALVAGAGLWQVAGKRRRLVVVLLALWLIFGAHTSMRPEFRYELDYLKRSDFHRVYRYMLEHIPASDFLILDHKARNLDSVLVHTRLLALPYGILYREAEDPLAEVAPAHAAHRYGCTPGSSTGRWIAKSLLPRSVLWVESPASAYRTRMALRWNVMPWLKKAALTAPCASRSKTTSNCPGWSSSSPLNSFG